MRNGPTSILNRSLTLKRLVETFDGSGVTVGVIDSGIDAHHPSLRGRITRACVVAERKPGEAVCEEIDPACGSDEFGHGTAVAGIIAHLAPKAKIVSVKVLGQDNTGSGDALMAGLGWALDQDLKLINISLAATRGHLILPLFALCERAYVQDAILVVSKKNFGPPGLPARFSSVIGVDLDDTEDKYHLRFLPRQLIELAARGVGVRVPVPGGGYADLTGTSFATPHVTGICALLLSWKPDLLPHEVKTILTSFGRRRSRSKQRRSAPRR